MCGTAINYLFQTTTDSQYEDNIRLFISGQQDYEVQDNKRINFMTTRLGISGQ